MMKVKKAIGRAKGVWVHPTFGANLTRSERWSQNEPDESVIWNLKDLEKEYGKLIAIEDLCKNKKVKCFLYFKDVVLSLIEHDGQEMFNVVRRNPSQRAELMNDRGKLNKEIEVRPNPFLTKAIASIVISSVFISIGIIGISVLLTGNPPIIHEDTQNLFWIISIGSLIAGLFGIAFASKCWKLYKQGYVPKHW